MPAPACNFGVGLTQWCPREPPLSPLGCPPRPQCSCVNARGYPPQTVPNRGQKRSPMAPGEPRGAPVVLCGQLGAHGTQFGHRSTRLCTLRRLFGPVLGHLWLFLAQMWAKVHQNSRTHSVSAGRHASIMKYRSGRKCMHTGRGSQCWQRAWEATQIRVLGCHTF